MSARRSLPCAWLIVACASGPPPPPAERAKPTPSAPAGTLSTPIERCGPRDSYAYIANEFRCPDGKNPLAGDLRAAARARSGAARNADSGHLVDTYEVPCAGGAITVFVDMYGCEEYERLLAERSPELNDVEARFETGRYAEVVQRCELLFERGRPVDAWSWCGVLEPAALVLLGDRRAPAIMKRYCDPMPPDGPKSDARVNVVGLSIIAIARGSRQTGPSISAEAASKILSVFADVCEIDPAKVVQRLEAESA